MVMVVGGPDGIDAWCGRIERFAHAGRILGPACAFSDHFERVSVRVTFGSVDRLPHLPDGAVVPVVQRESHSPSIPLRG